MSRPHWHINIDESYAQGKEIYHTDEDIALMEAAMAKPTPKTGDKIMIKLGNRKLETYIDEHGTQRITPVNKFYEWLYDKGKLDLNEIAAGYFSGNIPFKDYLEMYLSIHYSVSGFASLNNFQKLTIKNPLWED